MARLLLGRVRSHHPLLLEADEPPVADDHVVQEVDAEDLGGLRGVLGELHVLRRRRREVENLVADTVRGLCSGKGSSSPTAESS